MLSKDDLINIGYTFNPDPDRPGCFCWENKEEHTFCKAFQTEEDAVIDASFEALELYDLHRCDNCGKVYTDDTLKEARHLSMRTEPGGVIPSGECSDSECGALCYPIEKNPDWETVVNHFGLDTSFAWTLKHIQDYTQQYIDSIANEERQAEFGKQAIALLEDADTYLRDIRAENLDGSEPALGELLERITGFWSALRRSQADTEPDLNDIAEWVGQHYKVNFDAEPADRKADWIERYKESHNS